jgi:hypothetical protein
MWPETPIKNPMLIQLIGVENSKSPRREGQRNAPVRLYGHRVSDVAQRLVGVEVQCSVGTEVLVLFQEAKAFPQIEVPGNSWFFVGKVGENEALYLPEGS